MRKLRAFHFAALLGAGISAFPLDAYSAGFYLHEQSVKASGRAFAGRSAATDDTGVIAYNPAGMTEFAGPQVGFGGYMVVPHAKLSDDGSSWTAGGQGPFPINGDETSQGFEAQPTGYAYGAAPLSEDLWLGLAVTVPFGLKANYDADAFNRYDSLESKLTVLNIAPSLAYRVNDLVSFGASLDLQRADATLTNALPNPLTPGGPSPATDGLLTTSADDWSLGVTLGLHIRPSERLSLGFTYKDGITHTLSGDATTDFAGTSTTVAASAGLDLPDIISAGLTYRASERLTLLAEVNHFGWNSFEEIAITFEDGSRSATVEDFRNTWSAAVGAELTINDRLSTRGGLQYEETPTRDAYRSSRMPDPNRVWAAVGLTYRPTANWSIDLSYAHVFKNSVVVNRVNDFPPPLSTRVETHAKGSPYSNVFGLGLRAAF